MRFGALLVRPWVWVAVLLFGAAPLRAEVEPVSIWYRSSDQCPTGEEFVQRLAELGRSARLAGAGDRIDFVVTLGANAPESAGRLERQTASGTVAIREVKAPSCQQVAEALALSLDLALGPRTTQPGSAEPPAPDPGASDRGGAEPATTPAPPSAASPAPAPPAPTSPTPQPDAQAAPPPEGPNGASLRYGIGLEATLRSGISPNPMPGLGILAELGGEDYDSPSGRLHLAASRSEKEGLAFLLLSGRVEGCWPLVGSNRFRVGPCVHAELGALRANDSSGSGGSDTGLWGSAGANLLAGLRLRSSIALEAQLGGHVPFKRYETVGNDQERLFRTRSLGFLAGISVVWQPE